MSQPSSKERVRPCKQKGERTGKPLQEASGRAKSPPRHPGQQAVRRCGNGTTAIHGNQPQALEKEAQEATMEEKASREALAIMHHAFTRETKRINTAALTERVEKEKAMVKRSQILEECQAVVAKQLQVDKLGLDDPVQQSNAEEAIQCFMEGEYGKMIQEIRKKEQRTKEAAEKQKAAEEKERLKMLQSHPSTLMKDALESIVDAKFKEVQREGIEEQMEEETDVTAELERACVRPCKQKGKKTGKPLQEASGRAKSPPRHPGQQAVRRCGNGTTAIHGNQPQALEQEAQEATMEECMIPLQKLFKLSREMMSWLLGRYNRKHIWASRKIPPISWMITAMHDFTQRARWRWFFRHDSAEKPIVNFKSTSTCEHIVDPGLQHWLDTFYRGMVQEGMMARKRAPWRKSEVSNMNFLVRWGIQLLRSSPWKIFSGQTKQQAMLCWIAAW